MQSKERRGEPKRFVKTKKDAVLRSDSKVEQSYIDTVNEGFGLSGTYWRIDEIATKEYQKNELAKRKKAEKES
jgi:hypothetical protein